MGAVSQSSLHLMRGEPNILHLVGGHLKDGAALGALTLHCALADSGHPSRCLTEVSHEEIAAFGRPDLYTIQSEARVMANPIGGRSFAHLDTLYPGREPYLFSTGLTGVDITKSRHYDWADIIHLHWVSNGFFPTSLLSRIPKPVVWTIRDMWPFTGGCHYTFRHGCKKFRESCGACPSLGSKDPQDLSCVIQNDKQRSFGANLHPVGISDWITRLAQESRVFASHRVRRIYNGIDLRLFAPAEPDSAWTHFAKNRPVDRLVVGFGAAAMGTMDERKGFGILLEALRLLADDIPLHLLVFGTSQAIPGFETTILGRLDSAEDVRMAYAACDLFLAPSLEEAFGKTVAEAQACERPVVCFADTGCSEIVAHQVSGYVAAPFTAKALAEGIRWIHSLPPEERLRLGAAGRARCEAMFDSHLLAGEYRKLYAEVVSMDELTDFKALALQQKRQLLEIADALAAAEAKAERAEAKLKELQGHKQQTDNTLRRLNQTATEELKAIPKDPLWFLTKSGRTQRRRRQLLRQNLELIREIRASLTTTRRSPKSP